MSVHAFGGNLYSMPRDFDSSAWGKSSGATVTANTTTAPDGTLTADTLSFAGSFGAILQNETVTSGVTYTVAICLKANSLGFFQIVFQSGQFGSTLVAGFELSGSGATVVSGGASSAITSLGDGWYLCRATATATASGTTQILLNASASLTTTRTVGNGTVYAWFGQLLGSSAEIAAPDDFARILWDAQSGTITATSAAEGFEAANAGTIATSEWWTPTAAPATWTNTFAGITAVGALGIGAHRLSGIAVTIEAQIGGIWETIGTFTPADNSAILAVFGEIACTAIRVTIGAVARIGVIMAGPVLQMAQRGYVSLGQIDLQRTAEMRSYVSEGGQLMGRYVERRGLQAGYQWEHLAEDWYRETFDPFALAAQTQPFFIAARPAGYPTDVAYAWTDEVIRPQRMGSGNLLSVGFTATGHADG